MFFVTRGGMRYVQNIATRYVTEGEWVAEPVLWCSWTHRGTLKAQCDCEILALPARRFRAHRHGPRNQSLGMYAVEYVDRINKSPLTDLDNGVAMSVMKHSFCFEDDASSVASSVRFWSRVSGMSWISGQCSIVPVGETSSCPSSVYKSCSSQASIATSGYKSSSSQASLATSVDKTSSSQSSGRPQVARFASAPLAHGSESTTGGRMSDTICKESSIASGTFCKQSSLASGTSGTSYLQPPRSPHSPQPSCFGDSKADGGSFDRSSCSLMVDGNGGAVQHTGSLLQ